MFYTLENLLYKTATEELWTPVFAFEAKNEADALDKAQDWSLYHGHLISEVKVRLSTENEKVNWLHNEYLR